MTETRDNVIKYYTEEQKEERKYDLEEQEREAKLGPRYKWIALSNTTLGALMATINGSILIISLPAIFNGLGVNPLIPGNVSLLLWLILGYTIISSVIVVAVGRLSDMFGRVKLYNLGFLIFTIGSVLVYISSYYISGTTGALSIILLRIFQGLGGGLLLANSTAIIIDAFPLNERGRALGINQIAAIGGSLAGLLIGGVLASFDWHLVFLVSVPVGVIGTIWAYIALREIATIKKNQKVDYLGNITFAVSLTLLLVCMTYGLLPYGNSSTGWANPFVIGGIIASLVLMMLFVFIETKVKDPMFHLQLFRIRTFSANIVSMFLSGVARGGLQFMLVIWLQGIWLPLHGVSFTNTPLQAAIYMIPLILGFLVVGPIAGALSDKHGQRIYTVVGMLINAVGFVALALMPANFNATLFGIVIFIIGVGQGLFAAPNTTATMNAVPPETRGAASGMRATFMNVSFMLSLVIFFTLLIIGTSSSLQQAMYTGLIAQNV
jgi:MFS family permease